MTGSEESSGESDVLQPDEQAAVRAFLQRCEVRLSTLHRTATALLSGAGLLVVLPVVARDSITGILRSLVIGERTALDAVLLVAMGAMLLLPVAALWLLFRDLTRFYFHANHVGEGDDATFTLRFTLTSLRLPVDELGPASSIELQRARRASGAVELLVPANQQSRQRIDRQLHVYDAGRSRRIETDHDRAEAMFELAAAHSRTLLEEVAKIEHGMARHTLRLQGIVLRYVKALLALLVTAAAVYAGDAAVADGLAAGYGVEATEAVWLAGVLLVWAPAVVIAVTSPVRWIEQLARSDSSTETAVANDPELTLVERVSLRIAVLAGVFAGAAMVLGILSDRIEDETRFAGLFVLVAACGTAGWGASAGRYRGLLRLA
jgi:hypothetical protein